MAMSITRIIVAPKKGASVPDVFKIINLETPEPIANPSDLHTLFADGVTTEVIANMPSDGNFKEVMYHNGVIDPQQTMIIDLCAARGIKVEAVKVGYRYYGDVAESVYVNKAVHIAYVAEPTLATLKPRGVRAPMQHFDLTSLDDESLVQLSKKRELSLSLGQMRQLVTFQKERGLSNVTDVELETFAAFWSDHCHHTLWRSLGLLKTLQDATAHIGNPNLVSAFVDNAGVWDFYDGLCILFKLETHNSPTQKEPFGGQLTKLGGVLRDILANGLGAKPIGNIEMTTVGEFDFSRYPALEGTTLPASIIARETVQAIAGYGNPMGVPMTWVRMASHPDFGGKSFALGGTMGITTHEAANKGKPHKGDLVVMIGGRTGNDGLHGATISSAGITEQTDSGDSTHVQIGHPYTEQLMVRAVIEMRDAGCVSAVNDFGAAGIVSCFGEMGKDTDGVGGIFINLALAPLKCAEMANWQIALSESQERLGYAIPPEKWECAQGIFAKYGLEATVIGVFTDSGCFQMVYDAECDEVTAATLSGEVCLDVPYAFFDRCPIAPVAIRAPTTKRPEPPFTLISPANIQRLAEGLVAHFDVCDQSWATRQYDSTVQGITYQGPLYGRDHNVASSLGVLRPVYGKPHGVTVSVSFSPWQFEVDPVQAAINAMLDVLATQVVAGVSLCDIALADNFYTDGASPESLWYLVKQVEALAHLSVLLGVPFITGKDSSSGRGTFGGTT
ncbi:MAG: hypothetical protein KA054_03445, partial [Candidatus Moranbacteria bacterium]|nr:hypothetical protein [Candidatus Moranbacteria bacterium]